MARGTPDYGNPNYDVAISASDNGEIVSSNNGFVRLDNRGRVVFFDDWRGGLSRWGLTSDVGGLNPYVLLSSGLSYGYFGAVVIDTVNEDGQSVMYRKSAIPDSSKYGIEFAVYLDSDFATLEVALYANISGADTAYGKITLESTTGDVVITTDTATIKIVDNSSGNFIIRRWLGVKLVIDASTRKYDRLLFAGVEYDLSGYNLISSASEPEGNIYLGFSASALDAVNVGKLYIGYVALTADEP